MKWVETILTVVGYAATLAVVYWIVGTCWVGAEYVIEGVVHSSKVDGYVGGFLTVEIVRDIHHLQEKWRKK